MLKAQVKAVDDMRLPADQELAQIYQVRCRKEGAPPVRITLTAEEVRLGKLVPVRTDKMKVPFDSREFTDRRREAKDLPAYQQDMKDAQRQVIRHNFVADAPWAELPETQHVQEDLLPPPNIMAISLEGYEGLGEDFIGVVLFHDFGTHAVHISIRDVHGNLIESGAVTP